MNDHGDSCAIPERLAAIEAREVARADAVKLLETDVEKTSERVDQELKTLSDRVHGLERRMWIAVGIASTVIWVIGAACWLAINLSRKMGTP